jgi:hypothetical protein
VSSLNLGVVENGVAHACEKIRLLVYRLAKIPVLDQLQEHLVKRILSTTPVARNRRSEQQQSRPVLAVQELNLVGVLIFPTHLRFQC